MKEYTCYLKYGSFNPINIAVKIITWSCQHLKFRIIVCGKEKSTEKPQMFSSRSRLTLS